MKKNLIVKYQKIIGNPVFPPGIFCGEAVFERESEQVRAQRGKLFVLLSIAGPKDFDATLSSKMILDSLEEEYFREAEGSPLSALERAAVLASHRFVDLTLGGAPISGSAEFNLIMAVSWGQVLYLGRAGSGVVYLLRGGSVKEIGLGEESQVSTASGLINEGDVLILGTRAFRDLFPPEKILESLSSLEEEIAHLPEKNSLCVFILKFDLKEVPSNDELIRFAQEKKASGLSLSLSGFFTKAISNLAAGVGSFIKLWRRPGPRELFLRKRPEIPRHRGKSLLKIVLPLLCLLFFGSVFLTLRTQSRQRLNTESARLLETARTSISTATDLVDLNNNRARELLESALEDLSRVEKFRGGSEDVAQLRSRARTLLSAVTKEKNVAPRLLYDFALQNKDSRPTSLVHAPALGGGGRLFVSDGPSGSIFMLTLKGDPLTVEKIDQGKVRNPAWLTFYDETVFGVDEGGVFSISLRDQVVKPSLTAVASRELVKDFRSYLGNLYLLQSGPSAIFKLSALPEGEYSKPLPWLKEGRDLNRAVSFSVDGSIYVLEDNGKILKFEAGTLVDFTVTGFEGVFSASSAIYTDSLSGLLYVLDAEAGKLTVLSKDGVYQGRYVLENVSSPWKKPLFVVDESAKKSYFLWESKLFQVDLE